MQAEPPADLAEADAPAGNTHRPLLLRRWHRDDAALLKDAIDSSLDHLRAWMPWALAEPSAIEVLQARLDGFSAFLT